VPKICQKYQKPNKLKNLPSTGATPYIFSFPIFLCLLHMVEVTGLNSPLDLLLQGQNRDKCIPKQTKSVIFACFGLVWPGYAK
jgi:hypothetical protein